MSDTVGALPPELLTLWPKLQSAFRVVSRWGGRTGIIFISADDQGLEAARQVASAVGGKRIELAETGLKKEEYEKQVGRFLDRSVLDGEARWMGADRICLIIPRIDRQPKWLRASLKGYCERSKRPFVLLLTCPDLEWMPEELGGHLYECRKKGAAKKSHEQSASDDNSERRPADPESLFDEA
jgi:hypothetical protein